MTKLGWPKKGMPGDQRQVLDAKVEIEEITRELSRSYRNDDVISAMTLKSQAERVIDSAAKRCRAMPQDQRVCHEFIRSAQRMREVSQEFRKCKCPK